MRKRALTQKMLRDVLAGWKSFAAIFIMCLLAITLYCGIDATWRGMQASLDQSFAQGNTADLWIKGALTERSRRLIAAIPGVAQAQLRTAANVKAPNLAGEPVVALFATEGDPSVNQPLVLQGREATQKYECVLQQHFAQAHGLSLGDAVTVSVDNQTLLLRIVGLGLSPEYAVATDGSGFLPNYHRFGYAFVAPGTLDFLPVNECGVVLALGGDTTYVKAAIQALFKDDDVVVLARDERQTIQMAVDEVTQVRAIGQIFPIVFFVIAALITWTTMSRLVEKQRQQIGTLCSLGYGRGTLTLHFSSYGLLLGFLGGLAGLALGQFVIAPIIIKLLGSLYALVDLTPVMDVSVALFMCGLMVLITGGAGFLSCRSALRETPALLLRPKAPGKSRRTPLELLGPLWRHMRFSDKMIARNLFRNPVRLLLGLVGSVGCTALLLTGFGMRDSVTYVMSNHYSHTMRYDAIVSLSSPPGEAYLQTLRLRAGAQRQEAVMNASLEVMVDYQWLIKPLTVLEDVHTLVHLGYGEQAEPLPAQGIALTRKTAQDLGIALGEALEVRVPGGKAVPVQVTALVDIQLGQGFYISRSALRLLNLIPWQPNTVMLQGDSLNLAALEDLDGVKWVHTLAQERSDNSSVVKTLDVVVLLMILFSGLLALVVLYNLSQLNFSERTRELATLQVLGFYPREMKKLILRENLLIACFGIPIGLLVGPSLHQWVLATGLPNTLDFIPYIALPSWAFTACLTLLFALAVNSIMGRKFNEIDMVESLKSVE